MPARTPQILIVAQDARLEAEIKSALEAHDDVRPIVHTATDDRQGIEAARNRSPDLVVVELTTDARRLATLASEFTAAHPDISIAAAFRPDSFGVDVSESAVLIEAIRAGVRDFLRRPVSRTELEQILARVGAQRVRPTRRPGVVVSCISNKGGVGKSTTAVNLACSLAMRHPERVLLVDASLQMGTCAAMLDLRPEATLADAVSEQDRLDETLVRELATAHACGLHLIAAPPNALEAAKVDDEAVARVLTLARRAYDFVIVDTFPLLDRVVVAVLDHSDRAYIVLESVVPALRGATGLLEVLDSLDFPSSRRRLLLGRYAKLPGGLNPHEIATRLNESIDHVFPYDKRIVIGANTGEPLALSPPRFCRFARELRALAGEVEALAREGAPAVNGRHESNGRKPRE